MAISLEIDADIEQRLLLLSARTGKSAATHLRELIAAGIDELEAHYHADEIAGRVQTGQEPVYSAEQVRKDLGLDD